MSVSRKSRQGVIRKEHTAQLQALLKAQGIDAQITNAGCLSTPRR